MPLSLFGWSPQPNDSPSRFSAIQANVRSLLGGANNSPYLDSPVVSSNQSTYSHRSSRSIPKLPALGFVRRPSTPLTVPLSEAVNEVRHSLSVPAPLYPQHTAGSYQRELDVEAQAEYTPSQYSQPFNAPAPAHIRQSQIYGLDNDFENNSREPLVTTADTQRNPSYVDPDTEELSDLVHRRRRRHRHRDRDRTRRRPKRHHRNQTVWVRRKHSRGSCMSLLKSKAARGKLITVTVSAAFLAVILSIYLCIILLKPSVGQELHVLFILVIIGTTIFFCHSAVRLCMVTLHPRSRTPPISGRTGAGGFEPDQPIRVHLARDEELGEPEVTTEEVLVDSTSKQLKPPPPAYGLWRSSVRVDPNLLHWQRVNEATVDPVDEISAAPLHSNHSDQSLGQDTSTNHGPRPPSYISEDGVSYIVSAAPRSVAPPPPGMVEIHPAFRHPADQPYMPSRYEFEH